MVVCCRAGHAALRPYYRSMIWIRPEGLAEISRMYSATSAANTPLFPTGNQSVLGPHRSPWLGRPTTLSQPASAPALRGGGGGVAGLRHIAEWHSKRGKGFTTGQSLVVTLSTGAFLLYFMWLREPNDIDEYMSRPIWERVPGIDPEKAEQMMEMDKHLGLQVDYAALEKYKQEYYAEQLKHLTQEKQQRQRHQELLLAASSRSGRLRDSPELKTDA